MKGWIAAGVTAALAGGLVVGGAASSRDVVAPLDGADAAGAWRLISTGTLDSRWAPAVDGRREDPVPRRPRGALPAPAASPAGGDGEGT